MNVVALVSGGKDSCYSILKCRAHGHTVIALAHITPPAGKEEADSYMYQSVASSAIPRLAEALALPLYTTSTSAVALHTALSYTPTPRDEVEDLVRLLRLVQTAHPHVQAVCAGALWSDYQRLRVESAAARVGLLSLAYLWRRPQSDLLDEMVAAGVHAVLVKVAGVGLDRSMLGRSLEEARPTLRKLERQYGSHVCGEGGEYESLVLWMPGFEKRLVLEETVAVLHSPDQVAPVWYLSVVKCGLAELTEKQKSMPLLQRPEMPLPFREVTGGGAEDVLAVEVVANSEIEEEHERFEQTSVGVSGEYMHIAVRNPHEGKRGVIEAAKCLEAILQTHGESLGSVLYVLLYLSSVSGEKYTDANRGYTEVFGIPECTPPPSRACVGNFRRDHPTVMEAIVRKGRSREDPDAFTLHVQSLSEWAPPCIGPYAQIVEEARVIHVCGVLPLYAPLASIPAGLSARSQVRACAYNLTRTLEASRSDVGKLGLFIAYVTSPRLVEDVYDEMRASLGHDRSRFVVLPVSGLPKRGLVEIRAVGVLDDDDLDVASCDEHSSRDMQFRGVETQGVVCGNLGFFIVTFSRREGVAQDDDIAEMLGSAVRAAPFDSVVPLSLQVHISQADGRDGQYITKHLKERFPNCAMSLFNSTWLPRNASFICIATYVL